MNRTLLAEAIEMSKQAKEMFKELDELANQAKIREEAWTPPAARDLLERSLNESATIFSVTPKGVCKAHTIQR